MTKLYSPRVVVIEGNNTQKSLIFDTNLQRSIRSLGARFEIYQTVTGTGARSEQTNFDITTIGGLFDAGLITLPYGGPDDERQRVDDYITQLVQWRTDEAGHSIKYLVRDMVMATLFAESEAFVAARRGEVKLTPRKSRVPRFATNGQGGWRWQREDLRDRKAVKQTFSQEEVDQRKSAIDTEATV
jgi:hypothetical protein